MSIDITKKQENLPAELAGLGLEDVKPTVLQKKFISLNKDSGIISIDKGEVVLADSKKQMKITPIFTTETWDYVSLDGMSTYKRELVHEKNHNLTLTDEAVVEVDGQQAKRVKGRTILAMVQDYEAFGPMIVTLRRQKLWNATQLLSTWLLNRDKKIPIFGQQFLVSSEQKQNKKGMKFYVYKFQPSDLVAIDTQIKYAAMYKELRDSQDRLLHESEEDSGSANE